MVLQGNGCVCNSWFELCCWSMMQFFSPWSFTFASSHLIVVFWKDGSFFPLCLLHCFFFKCFLYAYVECSIDDGCFLKQHPITLSCDFKCSWSQWSGFNLFMGHCWCDSQDTKAFHSLHVYNKYFVMLVCIWQIKQPFCICMAYWLSHLMSTLAEVMHSNACL